MAEPIKILHVQGQIAYEDGEVVDFRLYSEGSLRWGNTVDKLGRAVDLTEQWRADVVGTNGFSDHYSPDGGSGLTTWEFTAIDRNGGIVSTVEIKTVQMPPNPDMGRDEPWEKLEISDVGDVLDCWKNADPSLRAWDWPDTEAADDPAMVSFVSDQGDLIMAQWSAVDDNEYDLAEITEGLLLPNHQYRIERKR